VPLRWRPCLVERVRERHRVAGGVGGDQFLRVGLPSGLRARAHVTGVSVSTLLLRSPRPALRHRHVTSARRSATAIVLFFHLVFCASRRHPCWNLVTRPQRPRGIIPNPARLADRVTSTVPQPPVARARITCAAAHLARRCPPI
jgi:hypothetical protein